MLSIAENGKVVNGYNEQDPVRERRNLVRRIRRAIRKDNFDLHYHGGRYYLAPIPHYAEIDIEALGRTIGAIMPVGVCVCREVAWHRVEGVGLCDQCAAEVVPAQEKQ
jgi:hypothetical protein